MVSTCCIPHANPNARFCFLIKFTTKSFHNEATHLLFNEANEVLFIDLQAHG